MAQTIVEELLLLQEGIEMYDAYLLQNVLVIAPVLALMGDNPRASEILGHLLGSPNKFFRQCMVYIYHYYHYPHTTLVYFTDRRYNPSEIVELRTSISMYQHFQQMAIATTTVKTKLKTMYGLEEQSTLFTKASAFNLDNSSGS